GYADVTPPSRCRKPSWALAGAIRPRTIAIARSVATSARTPPVRHPRSPSAGRRETPDGSLGVVVTMIPPPRLPAPTCDAQPAGPAGRHRHERVFLVYDPLVADNGPGDALHRPARHGALVREVKELLNLSSGYHENTVGPVCRSAPVAGPPLLDAARRRRPPLPIAAADAGPAADPGGRTHRRGVLEQDAAHLLDREWMALHRMPGEGNHELGFDAVDVRALVRDDAVARIRSRTGSGHRNDRVRGDAGRDRRGEEGPQERAARSHPVDAAEVRPAWIEEEGVAVALQEVRGRAHHGSWQPDETAHRPDDQTGRGRAAAVGRRDEDHPAVERQGANEERALQELARLRADVQVGERPAADRVPETCCGIDHEHLGEQPALAVPDHDHLVQRRVR